MGLNATVACNCYREGKTPPPPSSAHVILDELGEPTLDLPYASNRSEHEKFDEWKRNACQHEDMWLAFERVGNWTGVGLFLDMMEVVGWDNFPKLREQLAESNAGITPAVEAQGMLADLDRFMALPRLGDKVCLVDAVTGDPIVDYFGRRQVRFLARGEIDFELDPSSFVVRRRRPGEEVGVELFRSRHFQQELLSGFDSDAQQAAPQSPPSGVIGRLAQRLRGRSTADPASAVEFVDCDSGARITQHMALQIKASGRSAESGGPEAVRFPRELRVDHRTALPGDFNDVIHAIASACRASIATGNPIRWE